MNGEAIFDRPVAGSIPKRRAGASLAAVISLGTAGVATFLAMPVVAAAMVNEWGVGEREVGLFSTVQLVSLSMGCLLSTFLPGGNFRRNGLAALAVMLIADAACLLTLDWASFLILRAIGGAAGGVAVSQATAAMSLTANPERSFGFFLALQTAISIVCIYAMPELIGHWGFFAGYALLLVFDAIALLLMLAFYRAGAQAQGSRNLRGNAMADWLRSFGVLGSILCFFVGVGALWTFLALMGERIGLAAAQVALVLSISKLAAFGASFIPGLARTRFGRTAPIIVCVALLLASVQAFALAQSFAAFVLATVLFSAGWYALYPFQLGALGQVDCDGRPMLAAAALTGAGLGIGPALTVIAGDGLSGIYIVSAGAFFLAGLLAVVSLNWAKIRIEPAAEQVL